MSTLVERLQLLAQRIAAQCNTLSGGIDQAFATMGDVNSLTTDDKDNLVAAVNEVLTKVGVVSQNLANFTAAEATDLAAMTTTAKGTYGQAVNELKLSVDTLAGVMNGKFGDLATLSTTDKSSVVAAINELFGTVSSISGAAAALIDDTLTTSLTKTWSIDRIKTEIQAAKDALLGDAPSAALDTLRELGDALTADGSAIASITTALAKRVSVADAQTFTDTEIAQAWANLNLGDASVDLVAAFESALTPAGGGQQPSVG